MYVRSIIVVATLLSVFGCGKQEVTETTHPTKKDEQKPIQASKKDDKELLQGTWSVVSHEVNESAMPRDQLKGAKFTFAGSRVTMTMPVPELTVVQGKQVAMFRIQEFQGTFELRADKNPKEIDLVVKGPNDPKEEKGIGIYVFDGDTLKLCLTDTTEPRPTKFESARRSGMQLWKLERAKP
jgi:uncharacterized protein (TIGR03067 family)